MASTDAKLVPTKNTAYRVTFPILDADGDLVTGATGLDSEVSLDGGTFADCTNEATEIATSSGLYYLDLTAGEMNADTTAVIVKTTSSGAKTTVLTFYPQEAGDLQANVTQISGDATAADNLEAAADGTGYNLGGGSVVAASVTGNVGGNVTGSVGSVATGGITAASIATGAIDADAIAADAVTEIQSGLATASALSTVAGYLDTEVAAIKAKTDNLPAAPAAAGDIPSAATVADAVWDEARSGHVAAGSFGEGAASVQGNVTGSVGSLATQAKADVNAEVLDVLVTDTFAEPASVPAATSSLKDKLVWLFTLGRNKITQTATTQTLRNDADAANVATAAVSDDTTTFIRGEWT